MVSRTRGWRLSIWPGGGDQPLSDAQGRYALVCDGEIYNYIELRAQLEALGAAPLPISDRMSIDCRRDDRLRRSGFRPAHSRSGCSEPGRDGRWRVTAVHRRARTARHRSPRRDANALRTLRARRRCRQPRREAEPHPD
ncbi:hypothetical protein RM530_17275 [Algiphilus sp. W345]|uniref:Glutamine amidotransferase type-2 domain-containing protein n=1 Tax=Banduia mediterranea TaxID=3075609 RepID=A0ABU2WML6_9GAMM|nr:hypothetical protein [Algiphilus sp. W345]MDT0499097.1 hypothetical protein [Algiphilus sp. W345]